MEYRFTEIEEKWKKKWAEKEVYKVTEDPSKPKYYVLDMFPYPSGAGLHVGHPLGYVASDIYARYKRMKGYNVLHPMGYDAFGLPAEQYAIETGTHPAETTTKAIRRYREQLDKIGFSFDWSREVKTCDPDYYKWTQWIFLKLFNSWYNKETNKAEPIETLVEKLKSGNPKFEIRNSKSEITTWHALSEAEQQNVLMNYRLAYLSFAEVNWCEALGCVLANDEVKDGKSERGGYPVEKRKMRQWFLRITEYSDRLLDGLEKLDWSEAMKDMQRNWIGRSEGAIIQFSVVNSPFSIEVFTTRPDTIFGATFMVIAPEHELVETLTTPEQKEAVEKYIAYVKSRSDVERQQEKKVTGEFTGSYAINPFTGKNIPIYIAEYVLAGYGTGAIMAVPADDERDKKFAEKFGLPIVDIIDKSMHPGAGIEDKVGIMINSDFLNGMEVKNAINRIIDEIEKRGIGRRKINYKQRDAIYSRQRYWGEPIPIRYKHIGEPDLPFGESDDIPMPLNENELPLLLPDVASFKPAGDGRSPLANNTEWVNNGYETDTMPGYAGSSWYFLRYTDPHNPNEFAAKEKLHYWQNVDIYFGGAEHAVGHLLYARMWTKVLYDLGYIPFDEPFKKLVNQGMIQGISCFCDYTYYKNKATGDLHRFITSHNKGSQLPKQFEWNGKNYIAPQNLQTGEIRIRNGYRYLDGKNRLTEHSLKKLIQDTGWHDITPENILWENDKTDTGEKYITCLTTVEKMSKSKWNVVNPDEVIREYGADCFRLFEMFLGPIEQSKPWDDKGINGVFNFLKKFWRLFYDDKGNWRVTHQPGETSPTETKILHKTLKKLEEDIERLNFNTCVSAFMIAVNELTALNCHKREILEPLVVAIAPFAPFIAEELWEQLGNSGSVHHQSFPKAEARYLIENSHKYPVSINGKVRAEIELPIDITPEQAQQQILALDAVKKWTNGNPPKKIIFVKGRIVNVVI